MTLALASAGGACLRFICCTTKIKIYIWNSEKNASRKIKTYVSKYWAQFPSRSLWRASRADCIRQRSAHSLSLRHFWTRLRIPRSCNPFHSTLSLSGLLFQPLMVRRWHPGQYFSFYRSNNMFYVLFYFWLNQGRFLQKKTNPRQIKSRFSSNMAFACIHERQY